MAPRSQKVKVKRAKKPKSSLGKITKTKTEKLPKVSCRSYTPFCDWTGEEFGEGLCKDTDNDNWHWKERTAFYFCLQPMIPLLGIYVVKKDKEPRSGIVVFGKGIRPTWDDLFDSNILAPGFASKYQEILKSKVSDLNMGVRSKALQAFTMIQFEIARRVKRENHKKFPTREQIREAVEVAIEKDNVEVYRKMVEVFCGEKRIKALKELMDEK